MTDREPVNIMGVIAFPEPDKSKRRIRFIDAEYNTLFYIPDGASIVITRMDGSSVIRSCTYIDDYGSRFPPQVSSTRFSPSAHSGGVSPLALPLWVLYRLAAAVKSIDFGCGPICPCFLKKRTLRVIQQTGTFVSV